MFYIMPGVTYGLDLHDLDKLIGLCKLTLMPQTANYVPTDTQTGREAG